MKKQIKNIENDNSEQSSIEVNVCDIYAQLAKYMQNPNRAYEIECLLKQIEKAEINNYCDKKFVVIESAVFKKCFDTK